VHMDEPAVDLAHLGHVELLTPKLDESLRFFVDVIGLAVSGERGDSVYLRGWDDYERHTLKLTAAPTSGLGHLAFRARGPRALERRVAALQQGSVDGGWSDGDLGHGPAFSFADPEGHRVELYDETEWYKPSERDRPALKNQASRFPGRGANLRRLDHCNLFAADVRASRVFFERHLGMRLTEQIVFDDGSEQGA